MLSSVLIFTFVFGCGLCDVSGFYPRASQSLDYDPNPQYSYSYSVNDAYTGDNHAHQETRQGDNVQGSYSLVDADGSLRTVKYSADPINGFTAIVERSGHETKVYGGAQSSARFVPAPVHRPSALAYVPPAPAPAIVAPTISYVAPKVPSYRPVSYQSGGGSTHTSFSAPHANYHY